MFDRQKQHDRFLQRAKNLQTTTYNQPRIITYYLLAASLAGERGRVEIWQQIGVNLTRLAKGPLQQPVDWLALSFFRRATRHGDLRQRGAIRRDQAELLSKLGRFDEAREHLHLSVKNLIEADDKDGLNLTRIVRGVVYCRWANNLSAETSHRERFSLLSNAHDSLTRALSEIPIQSQAMDHQRLLALLWLADVCLALYEIEPEHFWLEATDDAAQQAQWLARGTAGSAHHQERAIRQIQKVAHYEDATCG